MEALHKFRMSDFLSNNASSVFTTAPAGIFFYGDKDVPRAFTKNSLAQFSSDLGLTYDVSGVGKTVVRAGSALVYNQANFFTGQRINQNPPFATATINTPVGRPLSFSDPYSSGTITSNPYFLPQRPTGEQATFPNGSNYIFLPDRFRFSYTIQWTASIQQELSRGWQMQLDYIGNHTVHGALGLPIDPAVFIPGVSTGPGS